MTNALETKSPAPALPSEDRAAMVAKFHNRADASTNKPTTEGYFAAHFVARRNRLALFVAIFLCALAALGGGHAQ